MSSSLPRKLVRPLAQRTLNLPPLHEVSEDALNSRVPSGVLEAAAEALERGETHYTDRPGIVLLRQLVAEELIERYGIAMTPKDITITCGATEARFVAIKLLAKPAAVVASIGDASLIVGAVQLANAALTTSVDAGAAVWYASPHVDHHAESAWIKVAIDQQAWIIWDMSAGASNSGNNSFHPAQNPDLAPHVVTIGGLDDPLPGWRVGWLAGSEAAEKLRALKQSMTICATSISQWAAAEYITVAASAHSAAKMAAKGSSAS
jgi:aspartate/methionine/tyrosine aminotransferase